jgi:hypothetical protein
MREAKESIAGRRGRNHTRRYENNRSSNSTNCASALRVSTRRRKRRNKDK